jgi:hypothetical protein
MAIQIPRPQGTDPAALLAWGNNLAGTLERILAAGQQFGVNASPAGPAGGGLSGQYPNPTVTVNGASVQGVLANNSTASTSGIMLGYGATIALTPVYSGKVLVVFNGLISNGNAGAVGAAQIHFGTGAAPASGATPAGVAAGTLNGIVNNSDTAGADVPFSVVALVTGRTLGVAYWFDLVLVSTAGTTSVLNMYAAATEVP